jgi:hypothetical protein
LDTNLPMLPNSLTIGLNESNRKETWSSLKRDNAKVNNLACNSRLAKSSVNLQMS